MILYVVENLDSIQIAFISSLLGGLMVSSLFLGLTKLNKRNHAQKIKKILQGNIRELLKIYDRLHADLDNFNGNSSSDMIVASDLASFYEGKQIRIEMIRINIENQLALLDEKPSYNENIQSILNDIDFIIETCYHPKSPLQHQLSICADHKDDLHATTKNTFDIATELNISS